jgi:acyl-CoA synthetase (AMP-forming)/AMP-acid ligase II/NAD(P)-dependent dehydrogenase (short-subunit alcohol dehydrogenase family)
MSMPNPADWPRQSLTTRFLSWLLNPGGAPTVSRLRRAVSGKTVLITGASFGIGEACARSLAEAGARVLLVARSREKLDVVAESIRAAGGRADVYPADLTNTSAVSNLGKQLLEAHGSIDIVVSNAGKSIRRSIALSYDRFHDFERTIGVNYMGPVQLLLALLPEMRRRKGGQIVNISTFGVRVPPGPRWGAYQASKAAFDSWFRSMGVEVRSDGVVTSSIYMPLVYTRMSAPTPSLRGLPGLYPEQAAGLVARAIVRHSRAIAPWWLWPAEVLSVVFRRPIEWGMGLFFRRSTDSPSARGTANESGAADGSLATASGHVKPPRPPSLRRAFRAAGLLPRRPSTLIRMARAILVQGGRPSSLCALNTRLTPNHPAVIDEGGIVTYSDLQRSAERLASALHEGFGVGPGSSVGIMCRNHRAFVEVLLAVSASGADAVLINTEFPGPQLAQVLSNHHLECLIHDEEFTSAIAGSGYAAKTVVAAGGAGDLSVGGLIASASGPLRSVPPRGRIVILTSGTTGVPKGAARTPKFRAQSGPLTTLLTKAPFRAGATILIAPPLFHGMGLAYLNLSLLLGAAVVLRSRFNPEEVIADIARRRVAVIIAVPSMLKRLLDVPVSVRSRHDLSSLRAVLSSGSPLGAELGNRFMDAFGPCLYNLYGSSEVGFGTIATPEDLRAAPGTVGYPPVGTEVRILDQNAQSAPEGQVGRVFLKTRLAFGGYTGGGTKEVIDGYMDSGDRGHRDAMGRLFIDGRADDMIISGGENVFPLEIEEVLATHPAVAESAVIGVPDDQFGQRLRAFVVARADLAISAETLSDYLKERVARFKLPREILFVPRLPRNALGKVNKRELGQM